MATLTPMCVVDPETKEADWSNFFSAFRNAYSWYSYGGDENEMNFYITPDIYLSCRQFENARKSKSTTPPAKIFLVCHGYERQIYNCSADAWNAARRGFAFSQGAGGFKLQLGNSPEDWDEEVLFANPDCRIIFAGLECLDLTDGSIRRGIYVPRYQGNISYNSTTKEYSYTTMDPTPLFFVTEDTDTMTPQNFARMRYISGATVDIKGTITGKGECSGGFGDIYISYVPVKIGGIPLGTEIWIYDAQGNPVDKYKVQSYDYSTHRLMIEISESQFDQIEVDMTYSFETALPVPDVRIPICGLRSNCISTVAKVGLFSGGLYLDD